MSLISVRKHCSVQLCRYACASSPVQVCSMAPCLTCFNETLCIGAPSSLDAEHPSLPSHNLVQIIHVCSPEKPQKICPIKSFSWAILTELLNTLLSKHFPSSASWCRYKLRCYESDIACNLFPHVPLQNGKHRQHKKRGEREARMF